MRLASSARWASSFGVSVAALASSTSIIIDAVMISVDTDIGMRYANALALTKAKIGLSGMFLPCMMIVLSRAEASSRPISCPQREIDRQTTRDERQQKLWSL